jgi:hypothetical protein
MTRTSTGTICDEDAITALRSSSAIEGFSAISFDTDTRDAAHRGAINSRRTPVSVQEMTDRLLLQQLGGLERRDRCATERA